MTHVSALDIDQLRVAGSRRPAAYRTRRDLVMGSTYLLVALGCLVFLVLAGVMSHTA